ncbi:hypothetical protein M885DRAFT_559846 [Pelagophyceae sp. CCMP2097]|nr:hypothetical protein M885DRAFT_580209 [Pelagophyceae sp. CCMP2097]KAJ1460120.1 hypothetical protein M885DRAFT_559846 [Pelagophyceae sp. CCMP2097]
MSMMLVAAARRCAVRCIAGARRGAPQQQPQRPAARCLSSIDGPEGEAEAPERIIKCYSCGEAGHVARDCPNLGNSQIGGTRIFVGNLPKSADWVALKEYFQQSGYSPLYARVMQRSRVFGSSDEAQKAIEGSVGAMFRGHEIGVREDLGYRPTFDTSTLSPWAPRTFQFDDPGQTAIDAIEARLREMRRGLRTLTCRRDELRSERQYDEADAVRAGLLDEYEVLLSDRQRIYWVKRPDDS